MAAKKKTKPRFKITLNPKGLLRDVIKLRKRQEDLLKQIDQMNKKKK